MPWVTGMVQVGARGLGSGDAWQIADARAWGSQVITMRDLRRSGVEAALDATDQCSRPRRTERNQQRYGAYEGTINAFINAAAFSLRRFGSRCTLSITASPRVKVTMTPAA